LELGKLNPKSYLRKENPLMHRTYRPKGSSVKALLLQGEEAFNYAATWCHGVVVDGEKKLLKIPTLDGVKEASSGEYVVLTSKGFKVMSKDEFEDRYDPVRNTRANGDD
jgi:hypothetical protein